MIFSNLLLSFLFYTRCRSSGLIWMAFSLSCFLKARSKQDTLQGKEKLASLLKLPFARQLVHFGPACESAHLSRRESRPSIPRRAAVRGSFRKKKTSEVTERAGAEVTARNGADASGRDRKGGGAGPGALRAAATELLQKLPARALSAARRPVVFSLSQPCFNCRFIFRQTGCLHLRLSASQALWEKKR